MACGTPVVGVNGAALRENLQDAAVLAEGSPEPFARALEQVLTDPSLRDRLNAAGLERARRFIWERTTAVVWQAVEDAGA